MDRSRCTLPSLTLHRPGLARRGLLALHAAPASPSLAEASIAARPRQKCNRRRARSKDEFALLGEPGQERGPGLEEGPACRPLADPLVEHGAADAIVAFDHRQESLGRELTNERVGHEFDGSIDQESVV